MCISSKKSWKDFIIENVLYSMIQLSILDIWADVHAEIYFRTYLYYQNLRTIYEHISASILNSMIPNKVVTYVGGYIFGGIPWQNFSLLNHTTLHTTYAHGTYLALYRGSHRYIMYEYTNIAGFILINIREIWKLYFNNSLA